MLEKRNSIIKLIISIAIPLGVGFLSSLLSINTVDTYRNLIQPSFAPPSWLFAPVWTILYILMGIAAYRIWISYADTSKKDSAFTFYFIQLSLNFLWSIIFFRFNMRFLALIEILLLLFSIIITTIKFYKIDKKAGYLMIPYILWASFATVLNYSIWMLNK
ncbi:TspO/MBR family protein [Sporosalibacterium faouarense]|uniref:TspO/MBR family protein n=1 Tax=Sporosalibacterium faouarense TaxID=516123 RepID=UPI00192BDC9D|nr:TspO/MBR family protein [Sporosalibacterium faouarense]